MIFDTFFTIKNKNQFLVLISFFSIYNNISKTFMSNVFCGAKGCPTLGGQPTRFCGENGRKAKSGEM